MDPGLPALQLRPRVRKTVGTLTYTDIGVTCPADREWIAAGAGQRRYERTVLIGHGEDDWEAAARAVMKWAVKRKSGFEVVGDQPATEGCDYELVARVGPLKIREPVRVVATVTEANRVGFAYGTLTGHPVSGEEAFVVHRDGSEVLFTLRSVTSAGAGGWRLLFPIVLLAQRIYRRRYLVALSAPNASS
jgi:uncharacterized protein (UPF0548 family)